MTDAAPRSPGTHDPTEARLARSADEVPRTTPLPSLDIAQAAAQLAESKKASHTAILHVSKVCSYADYFVICSAPSERQVQAIARAIDDGLRRGGIKPLSVEGAKQGNWVLIDLGDVVIHTFLDGARDYYDLEGFWQDAPRADVDEEQGVRVLASLGLNPFGDPL